MYTFPLLLLFAGSFGAIAEDLKQKKAANGAAEINHPFENVAGAAKQKGKSAGPAANRTAKSTGSAGNQSNERSRKAVVPDEDFKPRKQSRQRKGGYAEYEEVAPKKGGTKKASAAKSKAGTAAGGNIQEGMLDEVSKPRKRAAKKQESGTPK
jgi:hypothetical protein